MNYCYVNLAGGLGNQLFQIAAGFAYSKQHDKQLLIDDSEWSAAQGNSPSNYKESIFKNFNFTSSKECDTLDINELDTSYNELPYKEGNVSLRGYFQSLKYFESCKDEFIELLTLPKVDTNIIPENSAAFHIRRGDYLFFKNYFVCDKNYFKKAADLLKDHTINVFTDSVQEILNEFNDCSFRVVNTNSELVDMTLMSMHENVVCSNSTFSWWASLLGKPKKLIIVPSRWANDTTNYDDIYRSDFTKLEV